MQSLDNKKLYSFVNAKIVEFHNARLNKIKTIKLFHVLKKKNPYLFRAKHLLTAPEITESILEAFISSSEEEMFGTFLEELAIYISKECVNGHKSSASGLDLEFERDNVRYVVAVKSGGNWSNSSSMRNLKSNFKNAVKVLKQSGSITNVQPVLGICYGKSKTTNNGEFLKITGQNFWFFLSNNENLYIDIIEPIAYEASKHFDQYTEEKKMLYNRFAKEFLDEFCLKNGGIDWPKLVRFNSENTKNSMWDVQ